MHGCPLRLQPFLQREGINKKSNSWKTTSLSCAIRGHHHCNYEKSHLGSKVSFIQKQLQKYNIRDIKIPKVTIPDVRTVNRGKSGQNWLCCYCRPGRKFCHVIYMASLKKSHHHHLQPERHSFPNFI